MGRGEKYEWLKIWGSVLIKQTCLKLVEMNHFPFIFTLKLKFCAWEAFFIVLFLFPWSRARAVNKQVQYGFLFLGKWILKICANYTFVKCTIISLHLTLSRPRVPHWRVKSSCVRQSKIYKCHLALMGGKGLTNWVPTLILVLWEMGRARR